MRRTASLTSLITFIFIVLTSIVLFITPQGKIAYWSNWTFFGLTKEQWGAVHINLGILFILSLCFHIYFNWKAVLLYLKSKTREFKLFTKEFNISLAIVLVFIFGTLAEIPFFSTIIDFNEKIKDNAAVKYKEPPYGHAELSSYADFAKRMGIDPDEGILNLRTSGFEIKDRGATLLEIAQFNKTSPQKIYLALNKNNHGIKKNKNSTSQASFSGKGKLSLKQIAQENNADFKELSSYLDSKNIKVDFNMTLRENAAKNNMRPSELYNLVIGFSKKQ
ncbi:MAG: DUF4405 domain-containing protein [Desulforegulaceae bacterium]|nr:DUF4405 domain-containing protein [Desulforegulaceae bacterium]